MTDFLASLRAADSALFHQINQAWSNRALDAAMPLITNLNESRLILWLALPTGLILWIWLARDRALRAIPVLALTVGLTDASCHLILKPWFQRLRPEFIESGVILRAGSHSRYGFPSNHAANSFAAAVFIAALYPRLAAPALAAAALIAYSRVYVGAHFPADVLGGAIFGSAAGWLAVAALRGWITRKKRGAHDRSNRFAKP